jgi:hypothetical protein
VARERAVASIKAGADKHAANILPIIREAQKAGATTLRAIAEALNARGVATARGGQWHAMSVFDLWRSLTHVNPACPCRPAQGVSLGIHCDPKTHAHNRVSGRLGALSATGAWRARDG